MPLSNSTAMEPRECRPRAMARPASTSRYLVPGPIAKPAKSTSSGTRMTSCGWAAPIERQTALRGNRLLPPVARKTAERSPVAQTHRSAMRSPFGMRASASKGYESFMRPRQPNMVRTWPMSGAHQDDEHREHESEHRHRHLHLQRVRFLLDMQPAHSACGARLLLQNIKQQGSRSLCLSKRSCEHLQRFNP